MAQKNGQYSQTGWTLDALLPAPEGPALDQALKKLEKTTSVIEALRPTLSPRMKGEDFVKAAKAMEAFYEVANRLGSYGQLWFSADTHDPDALAFMGRMEQCLTESFNRILFFSLWWKSLDDESAKKLLTHVGDLRYYFEKDRLFKNHTLPEAEEKIINLKDVNGIHALVTLYDMMTSKFVFELEVQGQKRQLTRDQLMTFVRDSSPEVREKAYQALFRVFEQEATVLTQIYSHRVRDWASENTSLRRFSSPIAVRNLSNHIPDSVADTLLNVCVEQANIFHLYFKLKADWLGLPQGKLRRYDLYAPLSKKSDKKITYGDAVDMVLESFHDFSPIMADLGQRIFHEGHVDSEIRPNKRGGAFCAGVLPGVTPWVLVNYTGEPRQVATLAHELGHAVHALMAAEHSVLTFHSTLPMAETASVFSEMLLMDHILAGENDPMIRRNLLAEAIDDAYATVLRQAYFVIFERDAHRMIAQGKTLQELNEQYLSNLAQQFGDAVEVSNDFQYEWISIPHIYHTPFYCYAYSFGQLLSMSLYQQYKEQGAEFIPKLHKILAYGGSAAPNHILTEAGVNMADPDFWRGGFQVIKGMVDALTLT